MRTKLWHLGLWFLRVSVQSCSALWDSEALILVWIMRQSLAALLSFLFLLWMLCICDGTLMEASLFSSCLTGISKAKIQCGLLLHTAKEWHVPCWSEICQQPRIVLASLRNQGFQGGNTCSPTEGCCFYRCCWNGQSTNSNSFAPVVVSAKPFLM